MKESGRQECRSLVAHLLELFLSDLQSTIDNFAHLVATYQDEPRPQGLRSEKSWDVGKFRLPRVGSESA